MKHNLRFLTTFVCGLSMAALAVTANAGTGQAKVSGVRAGTASFSENGGAWSELKAGTVLKPGATIKTDSLGVVDLNLGKNGPTVRVNPDTTLALVTLNIEEGAGERIVTTELGLRSGKIQGVVRGLSAASRYEIMTTSGTFGVKGTKYQVSARGEFSVEDGEGYAKYTAPGASAPGQMTVPKGYTFEPTLNNNRGGLIETLPSVKDEIASASGGAGAPAQGEPTTAFSPTPNYSADPRPFAPAGQDNSFLFVNPPVANPLSPVTPDEPYDEGSGE
jgi:hypothetical protein